MRLKHFTVAFGQQVFRALADESRVRILHLLWRNQEMCISDLEQVLDFTQTKTSRQLAHLRSAGYAVDAPDRVRAAWPTLAREVRDRAHAEAAA